ncbi:MAG TPA: hypothetical protein ENJ95_04305 [Bacteroidetes bacterium]|nr:hypothetical protein [Bacteroidota bacterium]
MSAKRRHACINGHPIKNTKKTTAIQIAKNMFQLFLKTSKITQKDWESAYRRITSILENFPTKIIRLESYNGFSPELDKKHFDLIMDKGTPNEHISFWGDWMSYTGCITVRFYKNWEKQLELESTGEEVNQDKPITWYPHTPYKDDGSLPISNGIMPVRYHYIDTEGAHYRFALIAIGILLENLFPGRAFMTLWDENEESIDAVINWLEIHFNENFERPLFFDKTRLLETFINEYKNKKEAVCRMANLYRKKHKQNMEFAIKHIGYQPTFEFYAEVLADTSFGTFGFSDILMPWIAVTEDLEASLNLISASKQLLLSDKENERNIEKAAKYDLSYILKDLLGNYILWTPEQREQLEHFYTNKEALETGQEDLFGVMRRMMGYRVDICPIYATEKELFEAFMYHDPKKGAVFKKIIDDWINKNSNKYVDLKQKLEEKQREYEAAKLQPETGEADETMLYRSIKNFIEQYPKHEQFFIEKAIHANPNYIRIDEAMDDLKERVEKIIRSDKHQEYANRVKAFPKDRNINYIRSRIKEIGYSVHPEFERWLDEEQNENTLFHLHFLLALKLYDRDAHFARFRLLWDKGNWEHWQVSAKTRSINWSGEKGILP